MAFGPHGPRAPTSAPGEGLKVFLATVGLVGLGGVLYFVVQAFGKSFINFLYEGKKKILLIQFSFLLFFFFLFVFTCSL